MGDTLVPDLSHVTDNKYWRITGHLLALALLAGESLHPISPAVVYALLSKVAPHPDSVIPMHLSLALVQELCGSKADDLIPWMIIPPDQDWRTLPDGHRARLLEVLTNLDINVSGTILISYCGGTDHLLVVQSVKPVCRGSYPVDHRHCYRSNVWKCFLFCDHTIPRNGQRLQEVRCRK